MQATGLIIIILIKTNVECKMIPFVVGGMDASKKEFPYTAFLGVACKNHEGTTVTASYICGGSILNQQILLTAAHCVYECPLTPTVSVSVGHKEKGKGETQIADKMAIHEHYSDSALNNDIALLFVKKPFTLNAKVKRVAVMENPPYDGEAMVAGWGIVNEQTHAQPKSLQYTKQYVWTKSKCLKSLKSMPSDTICARNKDPSSFAANGDSGGPLVVRGYIQIGIVSNKVPGISSSIVIYTDVGRHFGWIQATANKLACQ